MTDDREAWISERAKVRQYFGGQDRRNAELGAVSDWELHCERLGLDPETGEERT